MAKGVHRDTGDEVEIACAIFREEVGALALDENLFRWPVDGHDMLARIAHDFSCD